MKSRLLKRELVFVAAAAAIAAGYLFLGVRLAPSVPPEPERPGGGVSSLVEFSAQWKEYQKRREEHIEATKEYNRFLRSWTRWGAAGGVLLFILYTFWRPPWYERPAPDPSDSRRRRQSKPQRRSAAGSVPLGGRLSRKAMLMMGATFVLLVIIAVLLVALATS